MTHPNFPKSDPFDPWPMTHGSNFHPWIHTPYGHYITLHEWNPYQWILRKKLPQSSKYHKNTTGKSHNVNINVTHAHTHTHTHIHTYMQHIYNCWTYILQIYVYMVAFTLKYELDQFLNKNDDLLHENTITPLIAMLMSCHVLWKQTTSKIPTIFELLPFLKRPC